MQRLFHIHGDNIVECERVFSIIKTAFGSSYTVTGPFQSSTTPHFKLTKDKNTLDFVFFPGFGRWEKNILDVVTFVKGNLREAADSIVSEVFGSIERPLFAIEYCSALPAGNNAWQRCGRAYSFANAKIPYIYLTDIGGFELDGDRAEKARRYPNPFIPFAYVCLTNTCSSLALPVFELNPATDIEFRNHFNDVVDVGELGQFVTAIFEGHPTDLIIAKLAKKALLFANLIQARPGKKNDFSKSFNALEVYKKTKETSFSNYMAAAVTANWRKSITIPTSISLKKLLNITVNFATGLPGTKTNAQLPFCLIKRDQRKAFGEAIGENYKSLPEDVFKWLKKDSPLVVCWIAGFKPRGDDSRPDRGLVPLARMLYGKEIDLLTVVYGPGKPDMWRLLDSKPMELISKNGLWEAIFNLSNAVIIDSPTSDGLTQKGYLESHWSGVASRKRITHVSDYNIDKDCASAFPVFSEVPISYGENDVDSAIHLFFTHVLGEFVYEGLCNPPGGDWSGLRLQAAICKTEYRWLTLPRVSGSDSKRPDHVFQIFGLSTIPVLLILESKETGRTVEENIGPRLKKYIAELTSYVPNVAKAVNGSWGPSTVRYPENLQYITGSVFISNSASEAKAVLAKGKTDICIAMTFAESGKSCKMLCAYNSALGKALLSFLIMKSKTQSDLFDLIII